MKQAVISLSGGMDSSTLLLRLLSEGFEVTALSFDYGQKHKVELERATELVEYLNDYKGLSWGFAMITHQIIKLEGLAPLLNSNLVEGGKDVPEGHYEADNMKDTVVPNRNKIFSSIIQAVALSLTTKDWGDGFLEKRDVKIALGIHAGDHDIYPDCRQEFRDADYKAFLEGNWEGEMVQYYTPYLAGDKFDILKDGETICKDMNLDFDEIYKRTMTSYKPIKIITSFNLLETSLLADNTIGTRGIGKTEWFSDYKSASSVERVEAFIKLGRPDSAKYADETGPVSWDTVAKYVQKILDNAS